MRAECTPSSFQGNGPSVCGPRITETLPALQRHPKQPVGAPEVDADEDAWETVPPDALRYLVASKAREIRVRRLRGL